MPQGFAERKVLFLHSLIQTAKERHNAEVRRQRLAAAAPPRVRPTLRNLENTEKGHGKKALTRADAGPCPLPALRSGKHARAWNPKQTSELS